MEANETVTYQESPHVCDQTIRLNDWMAANEPDIYWTEGDTADCILRVIEKYRARVAELEKCLSKP